MPYITKGERLELDPLIDAVVEKLRQSPLEKMDGRLNYVISKLLAQLYPQGYLHYNRAMGVLASAMQEFYRRRVTPYEDRKIAENGDVY